MYDKNVTNIQHNIIKFHLSGKNISSGKLMTRIYEFEEAKKRYPTS